MFNIENKIDCMENYPGILLDCLKLTFISQLCTKEMLKKRASLNNIKLDETVHLLDQRARSFIFVWFKPGWPHQAHLLATVLLLVFTK